MENKTFCQSCTMPLDTADIKGTENDGSKSNEYCKYCYQNGAFTTPDMTMKEMEDIVKLQMEKRKLPEGLITMSIKLLPGLKRWKGKTALVQ